MAVGVGEPDDLLDFAVGLQDALVAGGVAGHADHRPVGVTMGLGVEGSDVFGCVGGDGYAELFLDVADEGVEVAFAWFSLAAGM